MEIKLKGRVMPRGPNGDVRFQCLKQLEGSSPNERTGEIGVFDVFTGDEVVELVNRALYQLEYQRESHRKRGQVERDKMKKLKDALRQAGKDPKKDVVDKQLKGE